MNVLRPIRAGTLILLVVLSLLAVARPDVGVGATQAPQAGGEARLRLVEQTPWVAANGDFRARLGVDPLAPGATLSVNLHSRLTDRADFGDSLADEPGQLFNPGPTVPLSGAPLPPDQARPGWQVTVNADGTVDVALAVRDGSPVDDARALLPEAGVYPLVISVQTAAGQPIDELVLHLIRIPAADETVRALDLALVAPIHTSVALQPDGSLALSSEQLDRLEESIAPLRDHAEVPLTVAPTPETVDALSRLEDPAAAELLEQLRGSLAGRQVLGATFVDLDLSSWVASGLDDAFANQFTRGTDQLGADLATGPDGAAVRPDGRTWIADTTITPDALNELRELGVDQVVLPESMLGPLPRDVFEHTLTQTFDVTNSAGNRQRAIMADLGLASRVDATRDPVLNANRLLADLSILYFEDPDVEHGAAVVLPADEPTDPIFVDTLLAALETPTIVDPTTLNTLFARTPDASVDGPSGADNDRNENESVLVRGFAPQPSPPLGTYPDALRATQRLVAGYRSLLGTDQPLAYPLEELELVSGAAAFSEAERLEYLDSLTSRIDETVASIRVDQQAVTLTDRRGVLPVSVRNDLLEPITVRVDVESEKLEFPDSAQLVQEVPPGVSTLEITVEARASGAFPVDVRVSSPDDVLTLSEARVTVRSTAVSGLGIVLSVLAALFLLLWWARHFRSVRRANRLVSTKHPAAQQRARQAQDHFIEGI